MEKRWISLGAVLVVVGCGPVGAPKQAWERPPSSTEGEGEPKKAEEAPVESSAPPKEPSHEDVCRKMWTLIAAEAEAKAQKKGKKGPTDEDRSDFLKDCFSSGADEQKANPEKYACQKKCILDGEKLADVEKCGKGCK